MTDAVDVIRLAVAAAVSLGGVIAVSARVPRVAILGLLVALLAAPSVVPSIPDSLSAAPRLVGGVLAGYVLWIAVRGAPLGTFRGTRIGWLGELAFAIAGLVGGGTVALTVASAEGGLDPATTIDRAALVGGLAAGVSLAVVASGPVLLARDVLRTGLGLLLLLTAADLIRGGLTTLVGAEDPAFERLLSFVLGVATASIAAVVAWVTRRVLADGGDVELPARPSPAIVRAPARSP